VARRAMDPPGCALPHSTPLLRLAAPAAGDPEAPVFRAPFPADPGIRPWTGAPPLAGIRLRRLGGGFRSWLAGRWTRKAALYFAPPPSCGWLRRHPGTRKRRSSGLPSLQIPAFGRRCIPAGFVARPRRTAPGTPRLGASPDGAHPRPRCTASSGTEPERPEGFPGRGLWSEAYSIRGHTCFDWGRKGRCVPLPYSKGFRGHTCFGWGRRGGVSPFLIPRVSGDTPALIGGVGEVCLPSLFQGFPGTHLLCWGRKGRCVPLPHPCATSGTAASGRRSRA
jgi:hypothetical protein